MIRHDVRPTLPRRVIYNFVARCNMACTFCYVPFDGRPAAPTTALEVLERVLAWNIDAIVFGGGDPMMYDYTPLLIRRARESIPDLFVQLDTNARSADCSRLLSVAEQVDLIGLPVDGISRRTCAQMRRRAIHGVEILHLASCASKRGKAVKINTVVSPLNLHEIPRIRRAVEACGARIWSLYQFWPIGDIAIANERHHRIAEHLFVDVVHRQKARIKGGLTIESSGTIEARAGCYFFVAPTGRAFCTSATGDRFIELGDVLNDEEGVKREWLRYSDTHCNLARATQRTAVLKGMGRPA